MRSSLRPPTPPAELASLKAARIHIFALRAEELRQDAAAQHSLEDNRLLAARLDHEVAKLVTTAQSVSDADALRSAEAIRIGKLLQRRSWRGWDDH
jgi:hypothetical protein